MPKEIKTSTTFNHYPHLNRAIQEIWASRRTTTTSLVNMINSAMTCKRQNRKSKRTNNSSSFGWAIATTIKQAANTPHLTQGLIHFKKINKKESPRFIFYDTNSRISVHLQSIFVHKRTEWKRIIRLPVREEARIATKFSDQRTTREMKFYGNGIGF